MKLYMKVEKGDKVLREDHGGTFLVLTPGGYCFKSLNYRLEDYRPGEKVEVACMGNFTLFPNRFRDLPWEEWHPERSQERN
jgi:hypothetical protein